MKRILILVLGLIIFSPIITLASTTNNPNISLGKFFTIYFYYLGVDIDDGYKNIELETGNQEISDILYSALQKGVYLDLFPIDVAGFDFNKTVKQQDLSKILELINGKKIDYQKGEDINYMWSTQAIRTLDLAPEYKDIELYYNSLNSHEKESFRKQRYIFKQIYDVLKQEYLYQENIPYYENYIDIDKYFNDLGDIHTDYLTQEESVDYESSLENEYVGIGVLITNSSDGVFTISDVFDNGQAKKSGIQQGDEILEIDEYVIQEDTDFNTLIYKLKKNKDEYVYLKIKRGTEELDFDIMIADFDFDTLTYDYIENSSCYINISTFGSDTFNLFKDSLSYFRDKTCDKYIIDLRNNGGGYLEETIDILNYFINKDDLIATVKYLDKDIEYVSQNIDKRLYSLSDEKIILLVDKYSASAAELLVLGIQENNANSIVIGTPSYGKGSVQIIEAKNGHNYKYTVAEWSVNGRNINHIGIIPDINIENNFDTKVDEQLEFAINYNN